MGNINGLDDFLNHLQRVADNIDNVMEEALEETATMVISDAKLNTPVLSQNWSVKALMDS